ncbi:hypothetical protein [Vibrio jasicida]|uniref:hypothetical protein n=1 Tax=Vibrio jasicida TaxID=766224 RepID=UPI001CA5E9DE|nr:hypothetical protein [Vibrio jasicida]
MAIAGCISVSAEANMRVENMFVISNEYGNGLISLTNSSANKMYVRADIIKLETVNGELKKTPLTRDNFPLWDLAVSPAKTVMNPGEIKDFSIKYLCQSNCDRSKDLVYQVQFVPVDPPKKVEGQSVSFRFGVAPAYIIPAQGSEIDYEFSFDKTNKVITLDNTGDGFLKMEVDGCPDTSSEVVPSVKKVACRGVFYILGGRKKEIFLKENMLKYGAKVTVANHDQSYEKSHNISGL